MRKIFLDLGACKGTATRMFIETVPEWKDFEIQMFEPQLSLIGELIRKFPLDNVDTYPLAVSNKPGTVPFYIGNAESCSLDVTKTTGDLDKVNPTLVPAIDLSKWFKDNFSPEDFIVVKMNIEGAEYPVLRHMIREGTLSWIDLLYIEWHSSKIRITQEFHDFILKQAEKLTKVITWKDADSIDNRFDIVSKTVKTLGV